MPKEGQDFPLARQTQGSRGLFPIPGLAWPALSPSFSLYSSARGSGAPSPGRFLLPEKKERRKGRRPQWGRAMLVVGPSSSLKVASSRKLRKETSKGWRVKQRYSSSYD